MARKLAFLLIFSLFALSLAPGCTSPAIPPQGSSQSPPATQASGSGSPAEIYPGPVVTPQDIYRVEVQENRNHNPIHPDITVTFRGGKGQYILKRILVTVVKSDGGVISKEIVQPENGQIAVGDSVTFTGTTGVDRVIVVATILGKDYKILDMLDDYNSHP
ncbi:MAG TPA: hypothetical protein VMS81_07190 [Methanomicrobiales archaeon]|jgi:hypothetical protein|nr:hypothetical protein [Methanomicrobiales archaeon]